MNNFDLEDTICSITTGGGMSAIAIIRISGKNAIKIANSVFSKELSNSKTHTLHFGDFIYNQEVIDEILISIVKMLTVSLPCVMCILCNRKMSFDD